MNALLRSPAWIAVALFVPALLLANVGLPGYSHLVHPVSLLAEGYRREGV